MNRIEWQRKAVKQLRNLPQKQQVKIRDAVNGLVDFTGNRNVKKLKSHNYDYRLRLGNYRVLFNHATLVQIALIEEVRKRDESTY